MREKIVITGGPCSGKSTLISALELRGYPILNETAREIIKVEKTHPRDLSDKIIREQMKKESQFQGGYMDRSVIDSVAYAVLFGNLAPIRNIKPAQYERVFFLEPLPYQKDNERFETPEEAKQISSLIMQAYTFYGYETTIVPLLSVEDRIDFILNGVSK